MKPYHPLHGLPPLAGLATFEEAQRPGYSVEECVKRLKRYHYAFKRLHEIFIARLTAEPIYELKMAFSLHAHYCAEHAAALRVRVGEMREPPLGLDTVPDENLALFFDEILCAPTTDKLIAGLRCALTALEVALDSHMRISNPLVDQPSIRLCKFASIEVEEMRNWCDSAACVLCEGEEPLPPQERWDLFLSACLAAGGGIAGDSEKCVNPFPRRYSATPFQYDGTPQRDERFPDPYNMGVNAEAFLYDASLPPEPKVLMMYYKRLREIDVPEMMASIISETKGKPWGYYRDMTRQLWDEARHAMMGEVGFVASGIDWPERVMINFTWSLGLNTQLTPRERHGVLYFIEQGLMPKTGKRFEWETAQASGSKLSTLFQDYDWADEVLHARVGRDWYVSTFENPKEAVEWGDRCWSKVVMGWSQWRDEGLTEHRNWWPELYGEYCANHGLEPEPAVLAFDTSYETQRADLKVLSASG